MKTMIRVQHANTELRVESMKRINGISCFRPTCRSHCGFIKIVLKSLQRFISELCSAVKLEQMPFSSPLQTDSAPALHSPILRALDAQLESVQSRHHEALNSELTALLHRQDLAKRRLGAYAAFSTATPQQSLEYLGTPAAIARMRQRLHGAGDDEKMLCELADELRHEKERLTEVALAFYGRRCDQEGVFGGT